MEQYGAPLSKSTVVQTNQWSVVGSFCDCGIGKEDKTILVDTYAQLGGCLFQHISFDATCESTFAICVLQ